MRRDSESRGARAQVNEAIPLRLSAAAITARAMKKRRFADHAKRRSASCGAGAPPRPTGIARR
ncbi:hypothetical protein, partial [Burkholderia humptydooensis]|uniref:hypothetical protein n=1 Tax=Burkholderia humptydooensis TaxID=430531 RepID=UPI001E5B0301